MVGEHQICGLLGKRLRQAADAGVQVALTLAEGHVPHPARLEALVAVEDERRKQGADVGAQDADVRPEVERLGMRLLADDAYVMAEPGPGAGHVLGVDVRAGARQQVTVPEHQAHGGQG